MPEMHTIHRANGEKASMQSIDARLAVKRHPDEWSYEPFPADVQKVAQKKLDPYSEPDTYSVGMSAALGATYRGEA